MANRIIKLKGSKSVTHDVVSSPLSLFPLCDERGWLSAVLCQPSGSSDDHQSENLFFAWLLDLPASIDARDAAEAVLLVAESHASWLSASTDAIDDIGRQGVTNSRSSGDHGLKQELWQMLEKVIDQQSIEEPESLSGIISQVTKLDRE